MDTVKKLQLEFKNELGKSARLTVDSPKDDLDEATVKAAMESIVAKNAFTSKGGSFLVVAGAKVVSTTTNELF